MEAHERIGVQPVATRPVTPVDQHDLGVGVRNQRVGEGHPRRTGSHNEVVGLDFPHRLKATTRVARAVQLGGKSLRLGQQLNSPLAAAWVASGRESRVC